MLQNISEIRSLENTFRDFFQGIGEMNAIVFQELGSTDPTWGPRKYTTNDLAHKNKSTFVNHVEKFPCLN